MTAALNFRINSPALVNQPPLPSASELNVPKPMEEEPSWFFPPPPPPPFVHAFARFCLETVFVRTRDYSRCASNLSLLIRLAFSPSREQCRTSVFGKKGLDNSAPFFFSRLPSASSVSRDSWEIEKKKRKRSIRLLIYTRFVVSAMRETFYWRKLFGKQRCCDSDNFSGVSEIFIFF